MRKLAVISFLLVLLLGLSACSTLESNSVVQTMYRGVPQNVAERTEFAPPYHYLRVVVGGRVVFLASDTPPVDTAGTTSVWYSGGREVLRFNDGRVVAAVGLATEWRGVVAPELPSWSELAVAKEPLRWTRTRDVMPGYHYGVHDALILRHIAPPKDIELKGVDPAALSWFEERFDTQHGGTMSALPRARYAVDLGDAKGTVVYGEQCLSAELCFSWQRWPPQAESKK